jgi:hypothetical protein
MQKRANNSCLKKHPIPCDMGKSFATVSFLCPLPAKDNPNDTDNWKDAKLHFVTEIVGF